MSDLATWLATIFGASLVGLGMWETFMAVLHPRAVVGPLTSAVNRCFHRLTRTKAIASSQLILFTGPCLILSHAVCWATLLLLGFGLMSWPQLGSGITGSGSQPTDHDFITAIYYAGYTITTLGTGDLVPRNASMRLVTITASGIGFGFFTLVLAYVISIYGTLARRNQFACEIDYRTGRTGQTLNYLNPYLQQDDPSLLCQDLTSLSSGLADLLESHHFYPALHYFRFGERRYAMSQMLRFCLEVSSVLRSLRCLGVPEVAFPSEPVDRLWHASLQMLKDAKKHFVICESPEVTEDDGIVDELLESVNSSVTFPGRIDRTELAQEYQAQIQVWEDDLRALEVCTATER